MILTQVLTSEVRIDTVAVSCCATDFPQQVCLLSSVISTAPRHNWELLQDGYAMKRCMFIARVCVLFTLKCDIFISGVSQICRHKIPDPLDNRYSDDATRLFEYYGLYRCLRAKLTVSADCLAQPQQQWKSSSLFRSLVAYSHSHHQAGQGKMLIILTTWYGLIITGFTSWMDLTIFKVLLLRSNKY